jgi:hypothetical protein
MRELAHRKLLDEDSLVTELRVHAAPPPSEEPTTSEPAEALPEMCDAESIAMAETEGQPMAAIRLLQADSLSVARSISSQVRQ